MDSTIPIQVKARSLSDFEALVIEGDRTSNVNECCFLENLEIFFELNIPHLVPLGLRNKLEDAIVISNLKLSMNH